MLLHLQSCVSFFEQEGLEVNICARSSPLCAEPQWAAFSHQLRMLSQAHSITCKNCHLAVACRRAYWHQSVLPCQWLQLTAADMMCMYTTYIQCGM